MQIIHMTPQDTLQDALQDMPQATHKDCKIPTRQDIFIQPVNTKRCTPILHVGNGMYGIGIHRYKKTNLLQYNSQTCSRWEL